MKSLQTLFFVHRYQIYKIYFLLLLGTGCFTTLDFARAVAALNSSELDLGLMMAGDDLARACSLRVARRGEVCDAVLCSQLALDLASGILGSGFLILNLASVSLSELVSVVEPLLSTKVALKVLVPLLSTNVPVNVLLNVLPPLLSTNVPVLIVLLALLSTNVLVFMVLLSVLFVTNVPVFTVFPRSCRQMYSRTLCPQRSYQQMCSLNR